MELVLTVRLYKGLPASTADSVHVSDQECIIGRRSDCQFSLPDPDALLSGRHASVCRHGDSFAITDLGSTNGTYLNDERTPIRPHESVALSDGDRISLGPYELRVAVQKGRESAPADPFASGKADGLPGMAGPTSAPDIMELLGAKELAAPEPPLGRPIDTHPSSRGGGASPPSVEEMHFPLPPAEPEPLPEAAADAAEQESAADRALPPDDAIPEGYDLLSDELVGDAHREQAAGSAFPPETSTTGEREAAPGAAQDAVSAQAPLPPGPRPGFEPPGSDNGEQHPAMGRPSPSEPLVQPPRADRRRERPEPAPGADLSAFLEGLGVGDPGAVRDSEAMLRLAGQLLRAMTEGLITVMMARARFKSELRLEVTMIRSRDNNPFQFCVDADDALDRLLWRHGHGFLDPPAAVQKSFDNIQAHQMAMIAGIRAAMKELLARLEPERLEKQFEQQSKLEKLLPMARKSKCWDLFVSTFQQIADDAAEDFFRLFEDAFNRAYEEQVRRLSAAREQDPG